MSEPTKAEIEAFQNGWGEADKLVGSDGPKGFRTTAGLIAAFDKHDENRKIVAQALDEYGSAMRGDWSDIDGRSVLMDMGGLARLLYTSESGDIGQLRNQLGLCAQGGGHWECWCSSNGCEG